MKVALAGAAFWLATLGFPPQAIAGALDAQQGEDPFDDPFFDWPDSEQWPETPEDLPPDDPEGMPELPPEPPPDMLPELPPDLPPSEEDFEDPNPEHLERI